MYKTLATAIFLFAAAALPAKAETIDMATLKCSDISGWSEDQAALVMFWLHGYYGGKAGDTTVNLEALGNVATELGNACSENPELGVMSALKSVVGE